jgi:hypothetical protein
MSKTETTRFLHLTDLFEIKCKRCGSTDVVLTSENCHECGTSIVGECNKCGLKYDYHNFTQIEVTYLNGKEISNNLNLKEI